MFRWENESTMNCRLYSATLNIKGTWWGVNSLLRHYEETITNVELRVVWGVFFNWSHHNQISKQISQSPLLLPLSLMLNTRLHICATSKVFHFDHRTVFYRSSAYWQCHFSNSGPKAVRLSSPSEHVWSSFNETAEAKNSAGAEQLLLRFPVSHTIGKTAVGLSCYMKVGLI